MSVNPIIKSTGQALLKGIAFGVGFIGIIVPIIFLVGSKLTLSSSNDTNNISVEQFIISDTAVIRQEPDELEKQFGRSSGRISFTGTIVNSGKTTERYINVYADLYDKNGKFIYQCQKQFTNGLKRNEKQNFLINCENWPEEVAENYSNYKIYTRGING